MISRVSADYNLKIKYNGFRNEIEKPVFKFTMKSEKEDTTVSYYKDMCKQFPDVAFTLDDASKIMDHGAFYGYDGSMNLVGENYTEPGQKSIRIDASVIKKMQSDPEFEQEMLQNYITEIEFGDVTNREGHAAKVYFNALFGRDFSRSTDCVINAALNYGYSIILSSFTREIALNGYITQIGLFHDNMFNQFNLASDLMEPFRTLVDRQVLDMSPEIFEKEEKMELINVLNQEVVINNRREYVSNAVKIYTKSVFDALEENDVSLIRFYGL